MNYYIAGDLGGTNCRLLLLQRDPKTGDESVLLERSFTSSQFSHLVVIVETFLHDVSAQQRPSVCCFAVAGPVKANCATITNLNWEIDAAQMTQHLGARVVLINDFAAVGYGLLALEPQHLVTLNEVPSSPNAPIACLGAGTGLGEVFLTFNGNEYDVWPTEGGHTDFPARNQVEFELLEFMRRRNHVDRVSVERVVSGPGLPQIYEFFKSRHPNLISEAVEVEMRGQDSAQVVSEHFLNNSDTLCRQAGELWLGLYGAEAGNLALKTLPYGGLYIAGGIAPKIIEVFKSTDIFWRSLVAKGRMQPLIEKMPVHVVVHPNVGLLGAQVMSRRLLAQGNASS